MFIILLEHLVKRRKKKFQIFDVFLTKDKKCFKIIIEYNFFEIYKKANKVEKNTSISFMTTSSFCDGEFDPGSE